MCPVFGVHYTSFGPPYEGVRGNSALKAPLTNWPRRLSRRPAPYRNPVAQGFRGSDFFRLLANCSFLFFFAEQFFPDQKYRQGWRLRPKKAFSPHPWRWNCSSPRVGKIPSPHPLPAHSTVARPLLARQTGLPASLRSSGQPAIFWPACVLPASLRSSGHSPAVPLPPAGPQPARHPHMPFAPAPFLQAKQVRPGRKFPAAFKAVSAFKEDK